MSDETTPGGPDQTGPEGPDTESPVGEPRPDQADANEPANGDNTPEQRTEQAPSAALIAVKGIARAIADGTKGVATGVRDTFAGAKNFFQKHGPKQPSEEQEEAKEVPERSMAEKTGRAIGRTAAGAAIAAGVSVAALGWAGYKVGWPALRTLGRFERSLWGASKPVAAIAHLAAITAIAGALSLTGGSESSEPATGPSTDPSLPSADYADSCEGEKEVTMGSIGTKEDGSTYVIDTVDEAIAAETDDVIREGEPAMPSIADGKRIIAVRPLVIARNGLDSEATVQNRQVISVPATCG